VNTLQYSGAVILFGRYEDMTKFKTITMGATIAAFIATQAAAGVFEHYGEVQGWNVFLDKEKMSCLIEKSDDLGHVVQMGLMEDHGIGYLGVFTKDEINLKAGDKKAVAVLLGDNLYFGEATGMRSNKTESLNGGYILTDSAEFVEDIAKQYTMTVFPEQSYGFVMNLAGTYKALEMVKKCNAEN